MVDIEKLVTIHAYFAELATKNRKPDPGEWTGDLNDGKCEPPTAPLTGDIWGDIQLTHFGLAEYAARAGPASRAVTKRENLRNFHSK